MSTLNLNCTCSVMFSGVLHYMYIIPLNILAQGGIHNILRFHALSFMAFSWRFKKKETTHQQTTSNIAGFQQPYLQPCVSFNLFWCGSMLLSFDTRSITGRSLRPGAHMVCFVRIEFPGGIHLHSTAYSLARWIGTFFCRFWYSWRIHHFNSLWTLTVFHWAVHFFVGRHWHFGKLTLLQ